MGNKVLSDISEEQSRTYRLAFAISAIVEVELEIKSLSGEAVSALETTIEILLEMKDPLQEIPEMQAILKDAKEFLGE